MRGIADSWLRIDARSLGLFRILMGLTLLTDLFHRWDWLAAFYTNGGVLPNHNHLFLQGDDTPWSIFHAFSSSGEATFAFCVVLFVYVCFTVGWYTRVFHVVSVVALIGLTGRNVMLGSIGTSAAIALLAMTALMPCGLRYSVDSLQRSFAARDEKTPDDLNDRSAPHPAQMPLSLVPLCWLGLLAIIHFGAALNQNGATWSNGTALHYALHVDRWTGASGVAIRDSAGVTSALTYVVRYAPMAVVPLALIPVARRWIRPVAILAMALHGLVIGIFFTFGLYGWTLAASAALLIPTELWDAPKKGGRPLDVYYDSDCGICLWMSRLLKRLDHRHNLTFHSNQTPPEGISSETTARTMVVVDEDGKAHEDADGVSFILRSIPALAPLGGLLALPGFAQLGRWLYYKLADNRIDISVAVGLGACGVPSDTDGEPVAMASDETPAQRTRRWLSVGVGSLLAIDLLLAVAAQTGRVEVLPLRGLPEILANVADGMRIDGHFDLWSPDPPTVNGAMVVDAVTRGGQRVDVLTGYPPDLELSNPRRARKGVLWEAYTRRIVRDENTKFRKEFQRYLTRGGWTLNTREPSNYVKEMVVYWVEAPIPAPGQAPSGEVTKRAVMDKRGSKPSVPNAISPRERPPMVRPESTRRR